MTRGIRLVAALAVVMAVLIVAGTALLGLLIVRRLDGAGAASGVVTLGQPAGTRLIGVASAGHALALALSGGGKPDRVLLIDPETLRRKAELTITP